MKDVSMIKWNLKKWAGLGAAAALTGVAACAPTYYGERGYGERGGYYGERGERRERGERGESGEWGERGEGGERGGRGPG